MKITTRVYSCVLLVGIFVFMLPSLSIEAAIAYYFPDYPEREVASSLVESFGDNLPASRNSPCNASAPSAVALESYIRCFIKTPVGDTDLSGEIYRSDGKREYITYHTNILADEEGEQRVTAQATLFSNTKDRWFLERHNPGGEAYLGVFDSSFRVSESDFTNTVIGEDIVHIVNATPSRFMNIDGRPLEIAPGSETFSSNGRWMLFGGYRDDTDKKDRAISIYLVDTYNVDNIRYIGPTYGVTGMGDQFAVSDTGRTIIGSVYTYEAKLYHKDLSACTDVPVSGYADWSDCSTNTVMLLPIDESNRYMADIVLQDDKMAELISYGYENYEENNVNRYRLDIGDIKKVSPPVIDNPVLPPGGSSNDPPRRRLKLLAIGDSYISGEGAEYSFSEENGPSQYRFGTNLNDINKCHLSEVSYPMLLGKRLYKDSVLYNSIACSGAKMQHITDDTDPDNPEYKNQYGKYKYSEYQDSHSDYLDSIYYSFSPGNIAQYHFVEKYQPERILLSIGGNDMGFADIITVCVLTPTESCFDTNVERRNLLDMIYRKRQGLVDVYNKIKEASPESSIFVVGYPKIVAATQGGCSLDVQLSPKERAFSRDLVDRINTVIKSAAAEAGVNYVDIANVFKDNELCSPFPATKTVNGLTGGEEVVIKKISAFGNDLATISLGSESYHPTAYGHILMANSISGKTDNLSLSNPTPKQIALPDKNNDPFVISARQISLEPSKFAMAAMVSNPILHTERKLRVTLDTKVIDLSPEEQYAIEFHSETRVAYTGTVPADGIIDVSIDVPDLEPGAHTLHIISRNKAGERVDVMQLVYMANSDDDYDGDGILNVNDNNILITQEKSSLVTPVAKRQNPMRSVPTAGLSQVNYSSTTRDEVVELSENKTVATPATSLAKEDAPKVNNNRNEWALVLIAVAVLMGAMAIGGRFVFKRSKLLKQI